MTDSTYSPANGAWSVGYKYDAVGNLLRRRDARGITTTYEYSTGLVKNTTDTNRQTTDSSYTYDALGRLTQQRQQSWAGGAWEQSCADKRGYDLAGNVRAQTYPSERTVSYNYDDAGRRCERRNTATTAGATARTCGIRLIWHEYLPFGEEFVAGAGGGEVWVVYGMDGELLAEYTPNASNERDDETGIDYAKAGYYSRVQGRFTFPGPLLSLGSIYARQRWNRYTYTLNNPLSFIDPTGYTCSARNIGKTTAGLV